MVRITIAGRDASAITCPEGSNARAVKDELVTAFGPGLLKRGEELILTATETLSGDYEFHVTGATDGVASTDEGPRKRARTDSISEEAVYRMQYTTRPLQHPEGEQTINKTCFFVGVYKVLNNESALKAIWVTALHNGLAKGMAVEIKKSATHKIMADVIYTNELSDIAIVASDSIPTCEPLLIESSRRAMQRVVVAGYGISMHAGEATPCLLGCHISNVEAAYSNVTRLTSEFGDDEFAKWRTGRFFLLDKTTDFGFSGSPVVNDFAQVVGMLCASEYVSVSWALKSDFITEALFECVHFARSYL